MPHELTLTKKPLVAANRAEIIPAQVVSAGSRASERFLEFFTATIRNKNTRQAYHRATLHFFRWCQDKKLEELRAIRPVHVAAYIEELGKTMSKPSVKQHLAAVRMLMDWLVTGQILETNPAHSVRGPKHIVARGKTPIFTADEARRLLNSIDVTHIVGLRDRALIAVMLYTFARVNAAVGMKTEDYYQQGKRWWVRLQEKGGKVHEMPAHHSLEEYLDAYLAAIVAGSGKKYPLFRSAKGKTKKLTNNKMSANDAWRMIQRRVRDSGMAGRYGCHSFRGTGITNYLENSGTLEKAQQMAAHASAKTTKLYDRRNDQVTLDEVERIAI